MLLLLMYRVERMDGLMAIEFRKEEKWSAAHYRLLGPHKALLSSRASLSKLQQLLDLILMLLLLDAAIVG